MVDGIRNQETTRVYNPRTLLVVCPYGIRNQETTRVYNAFINIEVADIGIRNPETTRVYNSEHFWNCIFRIYATKK